MRGERAVDQQQPVQERPEPGRPPVEEPPSDDNERRDPPPLRT